MIWLLAQGYSLNWIRIIAQRYNARGGEGMGDGRHRNVGQKRLLNAQQEETLKGELMKAEANGEPWTGVQVAAWMSHELGQRVYKARGWEVLKRWGFKRKVPRP